MKNLEKIKKKNRQRKNRLKIKSNNTKKWKIKSKMLVNFHK